MSPRRRRRPGAARTAGLVVAAVVCAGLLPGLPASAESTADARRAAERLRTELAALQQRSAEAISALEEAEHELGRAVGRSATLARQLDDARDAAGGSGLQLQRRVAALYRSGGSIGVYASLLQAQDPADFAARMANVDKVVATDATVRDVAQDGAGRLAELEAEAREVTADELRAAAVAEERAAEVQSLLRRQQDAIDAADARVRVLVEQERRAAAAEAITRLLADQAAAQAARRALAAGSGGPALRPGVGSDPAHSDDPYVGPPGACPVGPVHSFTDTWHAPRSGGRQHQGTDVFAPYGAPAYAVVDGVIERWSNGGLGGIALWLRGDNGDRYYYAHNASNVAPAGSRVTAGQLVAYVGTTGNAATTPPHIHFEAHAEGGGGALNPYAWLRALCG